MNTEFNIFFTINNQYIKYLAVTIVSILYNAEDNYSFHFFILDGGINFNTFNK